MGPLVYNPLSIGGQMPPATAECMRPLDVEAGRGIILAAAEPKILECEDRQRHCNGAQGPGTINLLGAVVTIHNAYRSVLSMIKVKVD
jgi:hypothetical protein